jgi:hypothetical protein
MSSISVIGTRLMTKTTQELMIRRELAKDPKLANESWDRFLPQFRKRHLKTSEKTAKKNERITAKNEARAAAGLSPEQINKPKAEKKVYTPFPPAQQPRKVCFLPLFVECRISHFVNQVDLQLESGEYFLKKHEKEARETQKRKEKVYILWDVKNVTDITSSKRKLQKRNVQSVPRLSLPPQRIQRRPSRRNVIASASPKKTVPTRMQMMTILKRKAKRKRKKQWMYRQISYRYMALYSV